MKVLLDTNILLDALQDRQPFEAAAQSILLKGQEGEIKCYFTANAATDIFFIYSKTHGSNIANNALRFLLKTYGVVSTTKEDCLNALDLPNEDFEDALVEVCAAKINADYIITRDEEFADHATKVAILKPINFLKLLSHNAEKNK